MSKWIKVEHSLPPQCKDVLICENGEMHLAYMKIHPRSAKVIWQSEGYDMYPTHWMPLPSLPSEDDSIKLKPVHKTVIRIEE